MRIGLLARLGSSGPVAATGPAVLVVSSDNTISQMSAGAEERLWELTTSSELPTGVVAALVGAARRYTSGVTDQPARCRLRGNNGLWLVLHATTLSARDGAVGDVVVTIDEARPPEIVPIVVAAFDLTPRERDVTLLVLQGADTREIASRLHVSTYTVQDHLKSVLRVVRDDVIRSTHEGRVQPHHRSCPRPLRRGRRGRSGARSGRATQLRPFAEVELEDGACLDFMNASDDFPAMHYAFLVDDEPFDAIHARLRENGTTWSADPFERNPGEINHDDGGRGLYWAGPDGHKLEIITVPYGDS